MLYTHVLQTLWPHLSTSGRHTFRLYFSWQTGHSILDGEFIFKIKLNSKSTKQIKKEEYDWHKLSSKNITGISQIAMNFIFYIITWTNGKNLLSPKKSRTSENSSKKLVETKRSRPPPSRCPSSNSARSPSSSSVVPSIYILWSLMIQTRQRSYSRVFHLDLARKRLSNRPFSTSYVPHSIIWNNRFQNSRLIMLLTS